jgi:hypothetical protein
VTAAASSNRITSTRAYPGSALDQISEMDPEGWDYQMTEAQYRHAREQFRQRVIDQYGQEAWDSYNYRAPEYGE